MYWWLLLHAYWTGKNVVLCFYKCFWAIVAFCSLCPLSFIPPFLQVAHDALFIEDLLCKMQEDTMMSNDV